MIRKVCLFVLLVVGTGSVSEPISFRALRTNETIVLRFTSQGCFHFKAYELTFRRDKDYSATVRSLPGIEGGQQEVSTQLLTSEQVAGLDRLLAHYRRANRTGCTTVDTLAVTHRSASGQAITVENYVDGSCGADYLGGIVLLPDLRYQREATRPEDFVEF